MLCIMLTVLPVCQRGYGNKTRSRVGPRHPTMSLKAGSKRATLRSRSGCERKQSYTNGPENPPNA